jgi:hypothetical protein
MHHIGWYVSHQGVLPEPEGKTPMTTTAPQNTPVVPLPAGATEAEVWQHTDPGSPLCSRAFHGTHRGGSGRAEVKIVGTRAGDGTVTERLIIVGDGREEIAFSTPADVREAAHHMLAAGAYFISAHAGASSPHHQPRHRDRARAQLAGCAAARWIASTCVG